MPPYPVKHSLGTLAQGPIIPGLAVWKCEHLQNVGTERQSNLIMLVPFIPTSPVSSRETEFTKRTPAGLLPFMSFQVLHDTVSILLYRRYSPHPYPIVLKVKQSKHSPLAKGTKHLTLPRPPRLRCNTPLTPESTIPLPQQKRFQ